MVREYTIKASCERIFDIEAKSSFEAQEKARDLFCSYIPSVTFYSIDTEEYEGPTYWEEEAKENGEDIATDVADTIAKKVKAWKREHMTQIDGTENMEYSIEKAQNDIWDDLYQEEDIVYRAWEYCDSRFIYNYTDALIKAMDCIDTLAEYASGDSGLWEGKTEYFDIINIQACDALQGATTHYAEEAIKAKIAAFIRK